MIIRGPTREDISIILRDLGTILFYTGLLPLAPIIIALIYGETGTIPTYLITSSTMLFSGLFLMLLFHTKEETAFRHAIITTFLVWITVTVLSGIPFYLLTKAGIINSAFESISAWTTTGMTMFPDLTNVPKSLIFWRSLEEWIGGIGIIILALMGFFSTRGGIMPLAEAEGRSEKIKPTLLSTLKMVWAIYLAITSVGILLLLAAGMPWFSSVNYAMSAISSTGTFSEPGGLASFNNPLFEFIVGMLCLAGATSFALTYRAIYQDWRTLFRDAQFRAMAFIVIAGGLLIFGLHNLSGPVYSLWNIVFTVIGSITGGGFQVVNTNSFSDLTKITLISIMLLGGSTGSTTGGIKLSRAVLLVKSVWEEIRKTLLPKRAVIREEVPSDVFKNITLFVFMYIGFALLGAAVLMAYNYPAVDSIYEVMSCQSNVGLTTGITQPDMPALLRIMLMINMLVGRLEVWPLMSFIGWMMNLSRKE